MCPKMKNKNKWKKDEQNLVTTKSYVLIQTLTLQNWEVCVNWNTTCSFPRSMFPLGIETLWDHTFSILIQHDFTGIQSFKPLMSRSILVTWRIKWIKNKSIWKKMSKTYSQQRVMCQSKLYLFTSERHVSIETSHVHLQEVCSHKELRQYETAHSLFNLFFIWIQSFKPLVYKNIFSNWRIKLHSFPLSTRIT